MGAPIYLPENYRQRFIRRIKDVDPDRAWAGWEDEHWDGRQDATARPATLELKVTMSTQDHRDARRDVTARPRTVGVTVNFTGDPARKALDNMRRLLDKKKRIDTQHNRVMRFRRKAR